MVTDPTPISELHLHGVTFHTTTPLVRAGYTSAEQIAELVDEHLTQPEGSRLSTITGMGTRRVAATCDAVGRWRNETQASH